MLRKGVSSLVPGLVLTLLLIFLSMFSAYGIINLTIQASSEIRVQSLRDSVALTITRAFYTNVTGGPTVAFEFSAIGGSTLLGLDKYEVIASYLNGGFKVVELLKFNISSISYNPGFWVITGINVGTINFDYSGHPYLRPGEKASAYVFLTRSPDPGTAITIVLVSPSGVKAEYSLGAG